MKKKDKGKNKGKDKDKNKDKDKDNYIQPDENEDILEIKNFQKEIGLMHIEFCKRFKPKTFKIKESIKNSYKTYFNWLRNENIYHDFDIFSGKTETPNIKSQTMTMYEFFRTQYPYEYDKRGIWSFRFCLQIYALSIQCGCLCLKRTKGNVNMI